MKLLKDFICILLELGYAFGTELSTFTRMRYLFGKEQEIDHISKGKYKNVEFPTNAAAISVMFTLVINY